MVERGPPVADVCPGPIPFDDIVDASSAAAATPMLELIFLTTVSLCASAGIVALPVTGRSRALSEYREEGAASMLGVGVRRRPPTKARPGSAQVIMPPWRIGSAAERNRCMAIRDALTSGKECTT
jgi:hypothetical protein